MVKLPDKKSLEGFTKKVGEAVKLPDNSEKKSEKPVVPESEEERIRREERERIEKERIEKEKAEKARGDAEKAKEYEKIEAQKQAEKERLAEEARKQKEKDEWAREEDRKKAEEERKRAQIEKEVLARQKTEAPKKGWGGKIALVFIILLILIVAAAYVTLITGNDVLDGYGYPLSYTGQYDVIIPDSEKINFGPIPVQAISSGDAITLVINNDRRTISVGESVTYPVKHVIVKTLGFPVFDGDYEVTATYRGVVTNRDDFLVVLKTSQPIPGWLVSVMKPSGVDITTV